MNRVNARTALQHVVLGFVLVVILILVTICFNILGLLACSVLTGLMLGASRQWKWNVILVSLLFPAAALGFFEFSKGDILPRTRILLSVVCWVGFVMTYLLGYLLVYFERHAQSASTPIASHFDESAEPTSASNGAKEPAPTNPPDRVSLEVLQGQWSYESPRLNGERQKRTLQVAGDELVLYVTDDTGQVTCQGKGHLRLE